MKPPDEEYAKESFHKFLVKQAGIKKLFWKKSETPDFYLTVNNSTYALEITALMNKLNKEGINLPIAAMFAAIQEIKKKITEFAKSLNILDGAYLLRINKAIKISNPEKNKIVKSAIEYIQNSQHVIKNSSEVLFRKGNSDILIEKIHTEKQYVGTVGPTITRWEGESNEEIYALLKERIVSKAKKLKLNVVSLPKILILLDRYHIADHDQYRKAILKIPEKSKFDIIFFVGQEYEGISLYGEESFLSHI